jgi:hypothetical protein
LSNCKSEFALLQSFRILGHHELVYAVLDVAIHEGREVIDGVVDMSDYAVVDLILGVEKQGGDGSLLHYNAPYKTFPSALQEKLKTYCHSGGNLFVSGAFIASDMQGCDEDRQFIRNLLRFDYGGTVSNIADDVVAGSGLRLAVGREVNSGCYAVSRPDILVPLDEAFVPFVFDGCKESAGIAYDAGAYRVLSTSFPFEAVKNSVHRAELMGAVMRFLLK